MAYHFGWSIEYICSLSPVQFSLVMDGLDEILRQKYDPNYQAEDKKEIEKKITELKIKRAQELKNKNKNKKKVAPFRI